MKLIGIVGAGQMGSGIAQVAATAGFSVICFDISDEIFHRAKAQIEESLGKLVEKKRISENQKEMALKNLSASTNFSALKGCDLIIEAATENVKIKKEIFSKLDTVVKKETILASNTSSISIRLLASATQRPDKVLGLHFMNPVPLMSLVEVIRGEKTSEVTYQTGLEFIRKLGKTPITAKDHPGFVINRILCPMLNEAVFALQEGLATKEDIDLGMKLGCNFPMGPLALADFVGLDTMVSILEIMGKEPAPLLKKLVAEGKLGKKSGEGFYRYNI